MMPQAAAVAAVAPPTMTRVMAQAPAEVLRAPPPTVTRMMAQAPAVAAAARRIMILAMGRAAAAP
jgi:hypothetical protein